MTAWGWRRTRWPVPRLARHPFPGNVRELRSLIIDAVYRVQGNVLAAGDLAALSGASATEPPPAEPPAGGPDLRFGGRLPQLKEIGVLLVAEALRRTGGNQSRADALLGVSHQALSRRLRSRRDP